MSEPYEDVLASLRNLPQNDRRRAFATLKRERETQMAEARDKAPELPNRHWSKHELLQRIPNPGGASYEQKILIPEFTFLGVANQPDFGEMLITFYPKAWTIELKSLKVYKDAFRDSVVSYERLCNVVYDDLMGAYEPTRLRLMMRLRPRGGISSCLTIDSDWTIRGGKEQFNDWNTNTDRFGFDVAGAVASTV
ncbi:MAG: 7-cyano-7-deazaguanine reductase [Myxococcota bacterium]|jgi:7-cyano-7-deazaguanine reductase